MNEGVYWYRGPTFRDGEDISPSDGNWRVVKIGVGYASDERHICYMGSDWDGNQNDVTAMETSGEFVLIEQPP